MSLTKKPKKPEPVGSSFLPKDYLEKKVERRTGLITLTLFCVVMFLVVAAFFVTNRKWSDVKSQQEAMNREYSLEAKKIEQLKVLEAQKAEWLEKGDITMALIEKVPRSILMAELINRMPEELTLTELKLVGKRIKDAPPPKPSGKITPRSIAGKSGVAAPKGAKGAPKGEEAPPDKPKPPKMEFTMALVGLSQTDEQVADYQAALQQCPLLTHVDLMYTGEVIIDEVGLRKFRIEAQIRPDADARQIEPLHVPRLASRPGSVIPAELQPGSTVKRSDPGVVTVTEKKE
jgi:Tfp pilus assembly protein PilN